MSKITTNNEMGTDEYGNHFLVFTPDMQPYKGNEPKEAELIFQRLFAGTWRDLKDESEATPIGTHRYIWRIITPAEPKEDKQGEKTIEERLEDLEYQVQQINILLNL